MANHNIQIDAFIATRIISLCRRTATQKQLMALLSERVSELWPEVDKEKPAARIDERADAAFSGRPLALSVDESDILLAVVVEEANHPKATGGDVLNGLKISTCLGLREAFLQRTKPAH